MKRSPGAHHRIRQIARYKEEHAEQPANGEAFFRRCARVACHNVPGDRTIPILPCVAKPNTPNTTRALTFTP